MVQNGEGKCSARVISGIVEKTISEDGLAYSKVLCLGRFKEEKRNKINH